MAFSRRNGTAAAFTASTRGFCNGLLREYFLTSGKPLIEFGAHFIEEVTFDRIKHLAECRCLFEPGHAHVIGACRIEGGHVSQDVGDRDDLCVGIDFAQVPDKLCIRRAFEQRVGHRADEDLGRRYAGMEQRLGMADVPVNHLDAPLPQGRMDMRVEIDDPHFSKKVLFAAPQFFEQRTRCPKKGDYQNSRGVPVPVLPGFLRLSCRIEAIKVPKSKTLQT